MRFAVVFVLLLFSSSAFGESWCWRFLTNTKLFRRASGIAGPDSLKKVLAKKPSEITNYELEAALASVPESVLPQKFVETHRRIQQSAWPPRVLRGPNQSNKLVLETNEIRLRETDKTNGLSLILGYAHERCHSEQDIFKKVRATRGQHEKLKLLLEFEREAFGYEFAIYDYLASLGLGANAEVTETGDIEPSVLVQHIALPSGRVHLFERDVSGPEGTEGWRNYIGQKILTESHLIDAIIEGRNFVALNKSGGIITQITSNHVKDYTELVKDEALFGR